MKINIFNVRDVTRGLGVVDRMSEEFMITGMSESQTRRKRDQKQGELNEAVKSAGSSLTHGGYGRWA